MGFDWKILEEIQNIFKSDFMDWLMPRISMLGDEGLIWILFGLILIISKEYRKQGLLVWIGLLLGLFFGNLIVKNVIARPRPYTLNPNIQLLIPELSDYSFPSGHTLSSTIAATIITLINKKFGWVVIPLALFIAFSRLYLQVHYPTDIIGGIVMGLIIGSLTYLVGIKIINNCKKEKIIT